MRKTLFTLLSLLCCTTVAWAEGTGDGTKENPYTGVWQASELGPKLEEGDYLAFDCAIKDGWISVKDFILNKEVAHNELDWTPKNLIENPQHGSDYEQYGKDNPLANRKGQMFLITKVDYAGASVIPGDYDLRITGYFTGFYTTPDTDGFVNVESSEQMWIILRGNSNVTANPYAKVRLTDDIYLSDIATGTFCSTFYGTLDGNGHTVYGSHDGTRQDKTYLFTYSDGAMFKNLTFKNIRVDNRDHPNQAVITSQATNGCVFENITFDAVSLYTSYNNAGVAAGLATNNCTFTNITVKNSDITVNKKQSGAVVGYATDCSFANIKVEHCESTSHFIQSGGVVGSSKNCTYTDVNVLGSYVKANAVGGGIVGASANSEFTNCTIDDQSCVCVSYVVSSDTNFGPSIENKYSYVGGIVGWSENEKLYNCINSALIASQDSYAGGIVGWSDKGGVIDRCLNTGMVIAIDKDEVDESLYKKYKTKSGLTCETKTYQGKEYVIRKYNGDYKNIGYFAGIGGSVENGNVTKCANLGTVVDKSDGYSGGIVGYIYYVTISDCLSDFNTCSENVRGICGASAGKSSIDNCLNMTHYKDISAARDIWTGFSGGNNYSLTTATDAHHVTKTTVEKIQSGEICALLGAAWDQNLATDPYPTPTGSKGISYTHKLPQDFSTICLPFAIKSDEKVQYYKPQSAGYNDDKAIYYIKLAPVDQLAAGEPGFYRSLDPGTVYTFCNAGGNYQFTTQEYTIETAADGSDFGWTMSGSLQGQDYNVFSDDTQYTNEDRQLRCTEGIARYGAYLKGPSYYQTFVNADGVPTLIYLVSSTSPYDVNFDGEINVADVVECIEIINEQDTYYAPFIKGTDTQNLDKLTKVLLGE